MSNLPLLYNRFSGLFHSSLTLLLVPAFAFILAGCGTEAVSAPTVTVRDSAGITIVENPVATLPGGGGWSVAPEPSLTIGSFDGPEESQLYRVRGAMRLSDGRIAVGNEGSQEIRYFLPDGSFSHSLGGEGEGPGEFNSVQLAGRWGDSLVVIDRRQRRISLLHPEEGFVRSFSPVEDVAVYPMEGWFFGSGSILLRDLPGMESGAFEEGFNRSPIPFGSCDMEGALRADFGELPGAERMTVTRQTEHGLATMLSSIPFGKAPEVAVAGDLFYYGSHDSFQVEVFGSDGSLQRIVRVLQPLVPVTQEDISAFIEEEVKGVSDENQARSRRRDLEAMPLVEFRPPHGAMSADAQGYLFVEGYAMPGDTTKDVRVFDPEGVLVGGFELPVDLEVLEVGKDYLLGLQEDEFEVEYLKLIELTRPG
jgi:hypothetical protein